MIRHPRSLASSWCLNHVTVCGLSAQENNPNHISGNLGRAACQKREVWDLSSEHSTRWTLEMKNTVGFPQRAHLHPRITNCTQIPTRRQASRQKHSRCSTHVTLRRLCVHDALALETLGLDRCLSIMDYLYYSALKKGREFWHMLMNEPWGHSAKWNRPVTKGRRRYDPTYMRPTEESTS